MTRQICLFDVNLRHRLAKLTARPAVSTSLATPSKFIRYRLTN